jgi:Na+/H+ antiporter NhaC
MNTGYFWAIIWGGLAGGILAYTFYRFYRAGYESRERENYSKILNTGVERKNKKEVE